MALSLKSFIGGIVFSGAALVGITAVDNYVIRPPVQPEEPSEQPVPDALIAAVKTVIDDHNASLPETKEQALSEFKKSSPDGEGRIVKVGDVFQIHQDPATSGEYSEAYCNLDCISFEDFNNGRVPEIVARVLNEDEASLRYTSKEFTEAVLDDASWIGAISHATADNNSPVIATFSTATQRVCEIKTGMPVDCFPLEELSPTSPLYGDIEQILATRNGPNPNGP